MTALRRQALGALVVALALFAVLAIAYVNAPTCRELVADARSGDLAWNQLPDRCW